MTLTEIIIKLIIPALCAIITYYVIPVLKRKNIYDYVLTGVFAAEQIFGSDTGEQKFAYVKDWIKKKFNLSDEDLKNIIEAVVLEMNKGISKNSTIK